MMICFSIVKDTIRKEKKGNKKQESKTLDKKKKGKKMKTRTKKWVGYLFLHMVSDKRSRSIFAQQEKKEIKRLQDCSMQDIELPPTHQAWTRGLQLLLGQIIQQEAHEQTANQFRPWIWILQHERRIAAAFRWSLVLAQLS